MELSSNLPTVTAALLLSAFFPISFIALVALLAHHMPLSPHAAVDWPIARRFPSVEAFRHWSTQMEAAHRQREVIAFQAYSITLRLKLASMDRTRARWMLAVVIISLSIGTFILRIATEG